VSVVPAGSVDPAVTEVAVRSTVEGKHAGAGFVIVNAGAEFIVTTTGLILLQPSGVSALM
jgi:hypothetical protein